MENRRKTKDFNPNNCPVTHCLNKIGGKWKPVILHLVRNDCNRFSTLQKVISGISRQTLANQLREMEEDGLLHRTVHAEVPPRVEYSLSEYGLSLLPVIESMTEWGLKDQGRQAMKCS
ncbi:MAG: hypothetical protein RI973_1348 [Bacteroidota bacterium]|jgi:DNA-binding HxlR family transcriptional regulator